MVSKIVRNVAVLLISTLFALGIAECAVRVFLPQYGEKIDTSIIFDSTFPRRKPNYSTQRPHPDTLKLHSIIFNNLGLHQHRNFDVNESPTKQRIGFFGDSLVENTGMSVQYSFTEVLDYLLNSNEDKFEVLNFGMNGYGPDNAYISFQKRPEARTLDWTFFLSSNNDAMNIFENKLFILSDTGKLKRVSKPKTFPAWKKAASHFYLTYLFLEARAKASVYLKLTGEPDSSRQAKRGRHSAAAMNFYKKSLSNDPPPELDQTLKIFVAILREWKNMAADQHSHFITVLGRGKLIKNFVVPDEIELINLNQEFHNIHPILKKKYWVFQNDGHWNERGNLLAAVIFYRYLEPRLGLKPKDDTWIKQRLFEYYSAFPDGDWSPDIWVEPTALNADKLKAIRMKYTALDPTQ